MHSVSQDFVISGCDITSQFLHMTQINLSIQECEYIVYGKSSFTIGLTKEEDSFCNGLASSLMMQGWYQTGLRNLGRIWQYRSKLKVSFNTIVPVLLELLYQNWWEWPFYIVKSVVIRGFLSISFTMSLCFWQMHGITTCQATNLSSQHVKGEVVNIYGLSPNLKTEE